MSTGDLAWSGPVTLEAGESLEPTRDSVFVRRDEGPSEQGGLLIPEKYRDQMQHGTVVAVGPGKKNPKNGERLPMSVKVGDRVMYDGSVAGLFRNDNNLIAVAETDVLMIVETDDVEEQA